MPLKKIARKARKFVKKIIPKEVRAVAPYVAAFYGGPAMAGSGFMSGITNAALRNAISKGLVAGATQFATDDEADLKDIARAGILAAAPDAIAGGSEALATKLDPRSLPFVNPNMEVGKLAADTAKGLRSIQKGVEGAGALKTIGAQSAIEGASRLKEIEQDQIDAYNKKLMEDGIRSKAERRTAIRNIYTGIGYDEDYVDSMLDRFGYKKGGGVMAARMTLRDVVKDYEDRTRRKKKKEEKAEGGRIGLAGGGRAALALSLMDRRDSEGNPVYSPEEAERIADEYYDELEAPEKIKEGAEFAEEGFKTAFGVESLFPQAPKPMGITPGFGNLPRMANGGDVMSPEEYFKEKGKFKKRKDIDDMMREYEEYLYKQKYGPRDSAAEGGLMNLGGNEMDLRGGGFVPIGKKEKADDVPARLSKNEFVMTADAVRGAGGGDVNEGARRMYQTMDKLEAMA